MCAKAGARHTGPPRQKKRSCAALWPEFLECTRRGWNGGSRRRMGCRIRQVYVAMVRYVSIEDYHLPIARGPFTPGPMGLRQPPRLGLASQDICPVASSRPRPASDRYHAAQKLASSCVSLQTTNGWQMSQIELIPVDDVVKTCNKSTTSPPLADAPSATKQVSKILPLFRS